MDQLLGVIHGFSTVLVPNNFLFMVIGLLTGVLFAAVPGLTGTLAIALLLPITFSLDVETSLIMVASIFMGGQYGGSITAITVNIPGAPSAVMTAYEGNKLMRKGKGVLALRHAAMSSSIGGVLGALMLMAFAPAVAVGALYVQTPGKFALILFALFVVIASHKHDLFKGIIATILGLMVATIGIDVASPVARQTFGFPFLIEGVNLMAMLIGAFAVSEMLVQAEPSENDAQTAAFEKQPKVGRSEFFPRLENFWEIGPFNYLKFAVLGYFVGVLPGAGGSSAAFVSYAEAKRASKKPEEYGNGSVEGVAAAEGANNAMCGGSLVPMLTFGIPGDTTSAVILGVLIINGLQPGPQMMSTQFELVTPMMAALLFSAILIPVVLIVIGPYYLKLVSISKALLYATIAVVAMVGAYVSTFSTFQMGTALIIGVGAYLMSKNGYPIVSFLLGFILGPDLEVNLRRSLTISDGDPLIFVTSPDSLFFLLMIVVFGYFLLFKSNDPDPEMRAE
jgi:putative tricarboxylic transport membrane protein